MMELADAARMREVDIKRRCWPDHAWLKFRWCKDAGDEFATMFGEAGGHDEYIFSRDDLTADDWEVRRTRSDSAS